MSAHSKTPYITPSMVFPLGNGVVRGCRGQQLGLALMMHAYLGIVTGPAAVVLLPPRPDRVLGATVYPPLVPPSRHQFF